MATITTTYLGDLRTEIKHSQSGTVIYTDAPTDNHGKGRAFSPTDLFAASYASCALTIIGISSKIHGFDIDGTTVETYKVMGDNPRRVTELMVEFHFPHKDYSEKEIRIIKGAINGCPVKNSLPPDLKVTLNLNFD